MVLDKTRRGGADFTTADADARTGAEEAGAGAGGGVERVGDGDGDGGSKEPFVPSDERRAG